MKVFLPLQVITVLFSAVAHVNAMETAKVVCGGGLGNKRCADKNLETKVVSKDERYGARCCSDTPFFRSKLQDQFGCCVHGGTVTNVSGPGLELAHIYKGEEWFCPKAVTYAEAVQYCSNMGTRMCTEEELNNKCAKSTGCALNGALVWASTDEASTLCPTTSPSIEASSTPSIAVSSTPSVYSSMSPSMEPSSTPTICVENVALDKPTEQNRDFQWGGGFSNLAVDGNTSGHFPDASVTHTYEWTKDPWWTVDLVNDYAIDSIAVWNRNNFYERLADFVLTISRDGVDVYTYTYPGIPAAGGTANEIKLSQPVTGDKVKIQIFGEERILSLAEVQVFNFQCLD